jgi:hypothetical protein
MQKQIQKTLQKKECGFVKQGLLKQGEPWDTLFAYGG